MFLCHSHFLVRVYVMEALAHVHMNFRYCHLSAVDSQQIGTLLIGPPFLSLNQKFGRVRKVRMAVPTDVEVEHEETASKKTRKLWESCGCWSWARRLFNGSLFTS